MAAKVFAAIASFLQVKAIQYESIQNPYLLL